MAVPIQPQQNAIPDPLNQAALALLPKHAAHGGEAPLVSLMRQGLECGLWIHPVGANCPDHEQVVEMIEQLSMMKHTAVANYLGNPENLPDEEAYLRPEMLTEAGTALEAAMVLLDALVNSMIVRKR